MNNRKEYEKFFNDLKDIGIETYDIQYNDGYWVEDEKDCNVSFKIKGIKGWIFGAWKKNPDDWDSQHKLPYHLVVFCQYERFLDKFKPSRSSFPTDIHLSVYVGEPEKDEVRSYFDTWKFEEVVTFMKKYPAVAFCCYDLYDYVPLWKARLIMFNHIIRDIIFKYKENRLQKNIIKYCRILKNLGLVDYAYRKDRLNESSHINDYYYVYTKNKFAYRICKHLEKRIHYFLSIGSFWIYTDELEWRLGCLESYLDKDLSDIEKLNLLKDLKEEMEVCEELSY